MVFWKKLDQVFGTAQNAGSATAASFGDYCRSLVNFYGLLGTSGHAVAVTDSIVDVVGQGTVEFCDDRAAVEAVVVKSKDFFL